MSKHEELNILAAAAPGGPWVAENDSLYFKDDGYTRHLLDADAGHDVEETAYYAALKFIAAANPETILALIAENERLAKQWGDRPAYRTPEYESKRDAMWRRAHMVATSKGYDHINMAIAAAPTACTDCMGCGGEWQGEGAPNAVCETCKGSRGKALETECEDLRKEVARLKEDNLALMENPGDAL